jgi:hypothetical protein
MEVYIVDVSMHFDAVGGAPLDTDTDRLAVTARDEDAVKTIAILIMSNEWLPEDGDLRKCHFPSRVCLG